MNKKGFTLIELLVVVSLIVVIGISSTIMLDNSLDTSKTSRYKNLVKEIKNAAEIYISQNDEYNNLLYSSYNLDPNAGAEIKVTLSSLQGAGLLNYNLTDPRNNKKLSSMSYVKITLNSKVEYAYCQGDSNNCD